MPTCPKCASAVGEGSRFCDQCGTPLGSGLQGAVGSAPSGRRVLVAVLIVGLIVGSVVSAAGMYALFSGTQQAHKPVASFGVPAMHPYETHVPIGSISAAYPPSDYLIRLQIDQSMSQYVGMPGALTTGDYAMVTVGNGSYAVFWQDRGAAGVLDPGDSFVVSPMHGTACPTVGSGLSLFWMDRTQLATTSFTWDCVSKITLAFGTPTGMGMMGNSTTIPIAGTSDDVMPMNFRMRLQAGTNMSYPVWMAMGNGSSVMMPGYTSSFGMGWDDRDGSGTVSTGDRITVGMPAMMSKGTMMTLYIEWRDGSSVVTATWTT